MKTPLPRWRGSAMRSNCHTVLVANIDALTWDEALDQIVTWWQARESRYVCICNVHSVVTTTRDAGYRKIVNEADMCTPDGAPIAWAMRRFGLRLLVCFFGLVLL